MRSWPRLIGVIPFTPPAAKWRNVCWPVTERRWKPSERLDLPRRSRAMHDRLRRPERGELPQPFAARWGDAALRCAAESAQPKITALFGKCLRGCGHPLRAPPELGIASDQRRELNTQADYDALFELTSGRACPGRRRRWRGFAHGSRKASAWRSHVSRSCRTNAIGIAWPRRWSEAAASWSRCICRKYREHGQGAHSHHREDLPDAVAQIRGDGITAGVRENGSWVRI